MYSAPFTDPFRYIPSLEAIEASREVISFIDKHFKASFSEGKMLGVLVVRDSRGNEGPVSEADSLVHPLRDGMGFLAAFSGTIDGKGTLPYFVPPVFDITGPGEHFRETEAKIVRLNEKIASIEGGTEYRSARKSYETAVEAKELEVADFRRKMSESKRRREEIRSGLSEADVAELAGLIRQSQHEKAELRRIVKRHDEEIALKGTVVRIFEDSVNDFKAMRQQMSDELQQWIFRQYIVTNASGETSDIIDIFRAQGLTPPGGTGDCAAPKLLQYAFTHGLEPVSMGEFWYGTPPASSVRAHGCFYPSCQHKCGPLLGFMLRGIPLEKDTLRTTPEPYVPEIIYEDDDIIAANKPSGMLSAPGRKGEKSLQEHIAEYLKHIHEEHSDTEDRVLPQVLPVHRLDMDTSGVILYAKIPEAQNALQRQFEEGSVRKTYLATLRPPAYPSARPLLPGDKGCISLPLASAYEERPRQKADRAHGKPAVTEYEVLEALPDGETEIVFHPQTGRTHQLRIHSAHPDGLGRPIKGDLLYGGCSGPGDTPLRLHAASIVFRHPVTSETLHLFCNRLNFSY